MDYRRFSLSGFLWHGAIVLSLLAFIFIILAGGPSSSSEALAAGEQPVAGTASGVLKIDGKGITLKYAYAMAQPNTFDKAKTDIAVALTSEPLGRDDLRGAERLEDALRESHGWAFFKLDDTGKPIHEVIDHPAAGAGRLIMSGFTHADFISKSKGSDRLEGSFRTTNPEDFLGHKYEISADFSAPVMQAKAPEPLPDAKTGEALPPDGGEPAKAYKAYLKAIQDKDTATIRKMAPNQKPDMTDDELRSVLELMAALTPASPEVKAGYVKGQRAVLYLEGVVEGEKQYGTVELMQTGDNWRVVKEHWSNASPEK